MGLTAAQDEALLLCHLRLVWTVVLKNSAWMYGRIYTGVSLYKETSSNTASVVRLTVASPALCIMALFMDNKVNKYRTRMCNLEPMRSINIRWEYFADIRAGRGKGFLRCSAREVIKGSAKNGLWRNALHKVNTMINRSKK
ncbi:hypothetical protein PspLS_08149 [Pyricularia sp. CBS 133598]|nr:hypothetical protein PspLS_08149 [Pyricularia sp. CBS 133598]